MNRIDYVSYIQVKNAIPNGDADMANRPRQCPAGYGLISDVCIKRKIRDLLAQRGIDIYHAPGTVLSDAITRIAMEITGESDPKKAAKNCDAAQAVKLLCAAYYDVRAFGAVLTANSTSFDHVRGPVSISIGRTLEPIDDKIQELVLTTCAARGHDKPIGEQTGIQGRKTVVTDATYRFCISISGPLAEKTGFSEKDVVLLEDCLKDLFCHDMSAARPAGSMWTKALVKFEHSQVLGDCSTHAVEESVVIDGNKLLLDTSLVPESVKVTVLVRPQDKQTLKEI